VEGRVFMHRKLPSPKRHVIVALRPECFFLKQAGAKALPPFQLIKEAGMWRLEVGRDEQEFSKRQIFPIVQNSEFTPLVSGYLSKLADLKSLGSAQLRPNRTVAIFSAVPWSLSICFV
jgi:hypothetical protein